MAVLARGLVVEVHARLLARTHVGDRAGGGPADIPIGGTAAGWIQVKAFANVGCGKKERRGVSIVPRLHDTHETRSGSMLGMGMGMGFR